MAKEIFDSRKLVVYLAVFKGKIATLEIVFARIVLWRVDMHRFGQKVGFVNDDFDS